MNSNFRNPIVCKKVIYVDVLLAYDRKSDCDHHTSKILVSTPSRGAYFFAITTDRPQHRSRVEAIQRVIP